MTHDSIGLGEDGPTHQPVEHLASLRAMPRMLVFRPADAVETAECWQLALQNAGRPSVLALTRQKVEPVRTTPEKTNLCARGAYELADGENGDTEVVIFHRARIIGREKVRIAVEAGVREGWWRFISRDDIFIGMHDFGESAPGPVLYEHFGITAEAVFRAAMERLEGGRDEDAAEAGSTE